MYMCPLIIPNPGPPSVIGMLIRLVFHVLSTGSYSHPAQSTGLDYSCYIHLQGRSSVEVP